MKRHRYDPFKRAIDLVVGALLLVASLPVQAVVAVVIRRQLGSPVLFRQDRPGKDAAIFELVKFRTMLEPDLAAGVVTDEDRMTGLGAFLRSTSLDELPTLVNVVKGEMSLVGPRPLLVRYLDLYTPEQARRHDVRPGVTGLAQVGGRNAVSWADKFSLDVDYVDRRALGLDLKILARTVVGVLRREGITDGSATQAEFRG